MSDQCSISNNPLLKGLEKKAQMAVNYIDEEYKYMQSQKRYRDNYAILMTERREGFAEGYAEGFAKGIAK